VPVYRQLIEAQGGRFIHHDGGEEQAASQLDASLAAADLVICQTGCISHDAYWRVKDHCRRHGTPCVFVDRPSRSSLQRALQQLQKSSASIEAAADGSPSTYQSSTKEDASTGHAKEPLGETSRSALTKNEKTTGKT